MFLFYNKLDLLEYFLRILFEISCEVFIGLFFAISYEIAGVLRNKSLCNSVLYIAVIHCLSNVFFN